MNLKYEPSSEPRLVSEGGFLDSDNVHWDVDDAEVCHPTSQLCPGHSHGPDCRERDQSGPTAERDLCPE